MCAEPLEWVGYGVCGHQDVCSTCIARLRFVLSDKRCCICKQECPSVFMTKALGNFTKVVKKFEGLHECGYWYENNTQAFFDDQDHYTMVKAMCRLSCGVCEKAEGVENSKDFVKKGHVFKSLDLLRRHIITAHKLEMCGLCLEGRKIFICEQKLYNKAQLECHSAIGDSTVDGVGEERGGFAGHPMCKFCRKRYYGDNELYHHMSVDHYLCHICQRLHPGHYDYFRNYDDLEVHFRHEHSLCEHRDCLDKKFVVFTSDVELKRHNALTHGGSMSRSQRVAALQIPVSFQYRRPHVHGQGPPSNVMNGHFSRGAHAHNRLEHGVRGSLDLDFGTDSHTFGLIESESSDQTGNIPMRTEPSGYVTAAGGTMLPSLEESAFPPLPGSAKARRKTKHRNRGPPVLADEALSRDNSISSSQSHMDETVDDKASSSGDMSQNQWLQFSAREMHSKAHINVIHTASVVSTRNSPLPNKDRVCDNRTVCESVVNGLDNGFKLTEEVRIANRAFCDHIRSRLGDDEKVFMAFKDLSAQFRKGKLDANLYCKHVASLGLWDVVPELARLCPDPGRQGSLLNAYREVAAEKLSTGLKEGNLQLRRKFNTDCVMEEGVSNLTSVCSTMDSCLQLTDKGGTSTGSLNGAASFENKYKEKYRAESSSSKSIPNERVLPLANGADNKIKSLLVSGSIHRDLASSSTSSSHMIKMWSCSVCTLENSNLDSECAACGTQIDLPSTTTTQNQGKRTKKISKFERLRLDHDDVPPPQLLLPQTREPAQKNRSGGAWKNGGGQRLVSLAQREATIEDAWRRPS